MREQVKPSGEGTQRSAHASSKEGRGSRPGRMLAVFKAVILLALITVTAYGMLNGGLYADRLWLPVAAGVLALMCVTLFVRGFYRDLPPAGWAMVALLAVLVGVKGLSMAWTVSETETIKELLRSSTYLAVFVVTLAALTSGRQVRPVADIAILIVAAVAGYGLLQKINPLRYPVYSFDSVRIDSTLEYANTFAVILGMGVALLLVRMTTVRNVLLRGACAALMLAFLVALYLTVSRGGIWSLGIGLIVLFFLARSRLQMLGSLLLVSGPLGWLVWRIQNLEGLLKMDVPDQQRIADGLAFRNDLIFALVAAFVLQAGYAVLVRRFELTPTGRKALGTLVVAAAVLVAGAGAFAVVKGYGGVGQAYNSFVNNPNQTENVGRRLASLSLGYREEYWAVAWEAWKQRPLTGTGAGTFQYTWLENRSGTQGVKQVHNLYLEQGTETGLFAFVAFVGFVGLLMGYTVRAAWRSEPHGERRLMLAGFVSALVIYLVSSILEWHWYIPASTLFFFILAAVAAKFASRDDWTLSEANTRVADGEGPRVGLSPPQRRPATFE